MTNFYTFILALTVIIFSCKSASKSYQKGDYTDAIERGVKKLQKDPNDYETRDLVQKSYTYTVNEHEEWLRNWILNEHQKDWKTNVLGQCKSWIDGGLQPRAVTRDLDWGVKVPLPDAKGKVLYVWFDAPIGYISATKQWALNNGKDWEPYWKDKDTKLVHFVGKDNIVFHCIIFPVMLHLHAIDFAPQPCSFRKRSQ